MNVGIEQGHHSAELVKGHPKAFLIPDDIGFDERTSIGFRKRRRTGSAQESSTPDDLSEGVIGTFSLETHSRRNTAKQRINFT